MFIVQAFSLLSYCLPPSQFSTDLPPLHRRTRIIKLIITIVINMHTAANKPVTVPAMMAPSADGVDKETSLYHKDHYNKGYLHDVS